ncbi:hypothetical protein AnigIFM63604_000590 [Aspergillus niger]|uniref:Uncharacterized protein n=1 Tax=Aspergillus niger TaxID=5061 RepID=A0A9W6A601_ASPNG|nr:hypothetical protein AnigIFM63604_000590 [Aspergillus niger]
MSLCLKDGVLAGMGYEDWQASIVQGPEQMDPARLRGNAGQTNYAAATKSLKDFHDIVASLVCLLQLWYLEPLSKLA